MPVVDITPLANADILDIWLYIAADNVSAAENLVRRMKSRFASLATMPEQGESVDGIHPGTRRISVGNYVVYYCQIEDGIQIVRVLHGARRHEDLL